MKAALIPLYNATETLRVRRPRALLLGGELFSLGGG